MSGIAIFVEGGGDGKAGKAALREGFDAFFKPLKQAARDKHLRWTLVPCGSRIDACNRFVDARKSGEYSHVFLLVDSEAPVQTGTVAHLVSRDGQSQLREVDDGFVHLMIQTMETWIIADIKALTAYYRQGFAANRLPQAQNLEDVEKDRVRKALDGATQNTSKGVYHKIIHARDLLATIDPAIVHQRCPSSRRFFDVVRKAVDAD